MRLAIAIGLTGIAIGLPAAAQEIDDRMCEGRESCTLIAMHPAGVGENGAGLTVIELGFDGEDAPLLDTASWGCRFDPDGFEGGREYWLITDDDAAPERLASVCNDGYGAAMVGEDNIDVGNNEIVQERYGGSAWRWVETATLSLQPRRLLTRYMCSAYGAWTRQFQATDWRRSVSWYAWSPVATDEETEWCPSIDPTEPQPMVPKPYLLGLMVPGYEIAGLAGENSGVAGLGSCAVGLADADGPLAPNDLAAAPLRLAAILQPDEWSMRLVVELSPDLAARADSLRLDFTPAEYQALDWLSSERADPSPYQTVSFPLLLVAGDQSEDVWTLRSGTSGTDSTVLFIDRAPVPDVREVNLLGLAISVMADEDPNSALVSTVAWQDGAPSHTPPIAWQPFGLGWSTCRLDREGRLVQDRPATANPLDYH